MVVNMVVMGVLFTAIANLDGRASRWAPLFFATLLVGSDEVMFRGSLMPLFLEPWSPFRAVRASNFSCSIFHLVNVLGGRLFSQVLIQLANTFVSGTAFAFIALELGRLWPLIIFHFCYDVFLIADGYLDASMDVPTFFGALFTVSFGIVMAVPAYRVQRRGRRVWSVSWVWHLCDSPDHNLFWWSCPFG
ncbi:type II CAAX prenyl endopeptidase Rce1 family protein [Corynebacterium sp. CCM 9204]|uniref:CPBP family glutamic-type intramembrane protease n=1 Tax=Corynebacterium sp. CCM 9204 TaxID=3057616 RepID=UPI003525029A